ncbi:serine protease [Pseudodesulfovibrio sp. JC047]|uniref:patatin-like phospholipase family protein n=1 Tax=Pseudodesulfovibrio sp. JC047 TaxID=2683199 RepID=UPI0013D86B88|nr:patatin-like phospholipase family protein [Pseudodesulfovibrio sp. JC047]NDV19325.1 serine protease [Pseudodesulfovibrio sp. JC047]
MKQRKTVSLVLGSGGARGLAHIGIIHWLEENGYEIKSITGSSMGALVGGMHAIGQLDEFEKWVRGITKTNMLALLDFAMESNGLFKGNRIIDTLKNLVGEKLIEEMDISFTAVATDIESAKEVWIDEGPLFEAIRASISLPLFFTPYNYHGVDLIDGGILNPVPIAPTFSDHTDLTIAVNLCGRPREGLALPGEEEEETSMVSQAIAEFTGKIKSSLPHVRNGVKARNIVLQSFDAMQGTIARQKIAAYPPDHVLDIPRNLCMILDFDKAVPLIQFGHDLAAEKLAGVLE